MSQIDDLIQRLCPIGVEFKPPSCSFERPSRKMNLQM